MAIGSVPLLLWAVAVGALAGSASAWTVLALRRVEVSAQFRPPRAFAGEPVTLRVRVANRKRLPLPVVTLTVWLPPGLRPAGPGPVGPTVQGFRRRLYLPGRSEVVLDLPVPARRRGEYWLDRVAVEASDPFGLAPVGREVEPEASLLVMPEPGIAIPVRVRRRLPFGTPAPAARMFEERDGFAGVRGYQPGDPLNRVHWKLTGHSRGLQVKLFEPTRTARVLLALNLAAGEPFWDSVYPEIAEDTIGWASYLARQAIGAGWVVGVVVVRWQGRPQSRLLLVSGMQVRCWQGTFVAEGPVELLQIGYSAGFGERTAQGFGMVAAAEAMANGERGKRDSRRAE